MMQKKFEEAKAAFEKSSSLAITAGRENKTVGKMVRECDIQISQGKREEKAIYQKMFK
jgi:3-deoxy-D-manno-octulosonate 8-phosphate phosphatase KdsC-like HAD superfamily phosphatase